MKRRLSEDPKTLEGRRKKNGRLLLATGGVLILITGLGGWLVHLATEIQTNLEASIALAPVLQNDLTQSNSEASRQTYLAMRSHVERAQRAATDPVWKAASSIPVLGPNLSAVTEVSVSANDLVVSGVGPIFEASESLDWSKLSPIDGRIDTETIERAAPKLEAAAKTAELSHDRLTSIDQSMLMEQIVTPLNQAIVALGEFRTALRNASSAATLLPAMLGSEQERNYIVLVQNNAEIRATGGIPGALAVLRSTDGRIEMISQASASDLPQFDPPVIVDPEQAVIYSSRMGAFIQSINLTPDFPTVAQTATQMWETQNPESSIDGVISLDPVALAHILQATGPIELSFDDPGLMQLAQNSGLPTSLSADNVVPTLLSDVYAAIESPVLQDAYFAAVAADVFAAVVSGDSEGSALLQSLKRSTEERRLSVWSKNSEEQNIIATTELVGSVTGAGSGGAAFGAYFNDGTGAKMDYYVRRTVQLNRSCTGDGYLRYTLTTTLTNTAPADAEKSLPAYVTGGGVFEVPPGTIQTNFVAYGPDQSLLQTARIDGEPAPLGSYRHGDRPVGILTTSIAPGQSARAEIDFTNVVQSSEPVLDVTPTIQPLNEVVLPLQGDTACD